VSAILEPNVKLIRLKEISNYIYSAEANVKAYTIRRDTAYLLSYEENINKLSTQLDTLFWLSSESKIIDVNEAKSDQNFLKQIDTLRELIIERIDLFSKYIELKTVDNSQIPLLQLLQKMKAATLDLKNISEQNAGTLKNLFFYKFFPSKKKKRKYTRFSSGKHSKNYYQYTAGRKNKRRAGLV